MDCSTGCKAPAREAREAREARVARGGGVTGVTGGGDKPVGVARVAAATRGDRAACGASTRLR